MVREACVYVRVLVYVCVRACVYVCENESNTFFSTFYVILSHAGTGSHNGTRTQS